MPSLVIEDGALKNRRFSLASGTTRLGRVADNQIALDGPSISSHHCEIIVSSSGVRLRDLDSTNGTFVNGTRVSESPLFRNDRVVFGDTPAVIVGDDIPERQAQAETAEDDVAQDVLPRPPRPTITIASASDKQRTLVCPPDFKKRRDMRPIWIALIVLLVLLIVFGAYRFITTVY